MQSFDIRDDLMSYSLVMDIHVNVEPLWSTHMLPTPSPPLKDVFTP